MRIGLYGGSFDPVHLGHLLVAIAAREELGLDRVVFIPAARSPFKPASQPAPDHLRLRWLRLALAGRPEFSVDDLELRRGGTSYTVDTVREFMNRHPGAEFAWLIGEDHVPTLPQWREAEVLAGLVTFISIPRPGSGAAAAPARFRVQALRGWPLGISSSEIRERLRKGQAVDHLLPAAVAESVIASGVYGA